jgi:hypothetical protein
MVAQGQEWIRSDKKDEIETFYQYEKVGTDRFEVRVKAINYRRKAIKLIVQVEHKNSGVKIGRGRFFYPQSRSYYDRCELTVPPGGSSICEGITVSAKKITGVKIVQWDNVDSKSNSPRVYPRPRF